MVRRIVALYLMLATAVGPSLCCCALAPHRATARGAAETCPCQAEAPPCCRAAAVKTPILTRAPADQPTPHHCPCREHGSKPAIVAARATEASEGLASPFAVDIAGSPVSVTLPVLSAPPDPTDSPSPLPPGRDLLRAHHRLRC